MGITVPHLKKLNTGSLDDIARGFSNSSSQFNDAEDSFIRKVASPIEAGTVWSGVGQPHASVVMQINLSALSIGKVEMQAANSTMLAFGSAMSTAQAKLTSLEAEAQRENVKINDDGSCEKSDDVHVAPGPYGPNPGVAATLAATDLEPRVKGVLAFASVADATCKGLLDRIATHTPQFSETADPAILAHNNKTLGEALNDRKYADANKRFWEDATPKPLPREPGPVESFFDGVGNFGSYLWDNPGDIATLAGDVGLTALGIAGILVGAGGEVGGAVLDLGVVTIPVGVTVAAASATLIVAGAGTAAYGAQKLGTDLRQMNSQAQSRAGGSSSGSAKPSPPRYKPTDNAARSREFAKSTSDAKGKANNYAKRMRRNGYEVKVPRPREGKYGQSDVTVTVVNKYGKVVHVRHFIYRGKS